MQMKKNVIAAVLAATVYGCAVGAADFTISIDPAKAPIKDMKNNTCAPVLGYAGVMCEGGNCEWLLRDHPDYTARAFRQSGAWLMRQWSANNWWEKGVLGVAERGKKAMDPKFLYDFLKKNDLKALFTIEQWSMIDPQTGKRTNDIGVVKRRITDYVKWVKDNGYECVVAGFELGNETYFDPHSEQIGARWCEIVPEIRKIMPNVKLGIPLGEYTEGDPDFQAVMNRWRSADEIKARESLDVDTDRLKSNSARFIVALRPVMKEISHVIYHGYGADKPWSSSMYGFKRFRDFRDRFPETKGKPMWITEWRERSDEDVRCHRRFSEGLWRAHFLMTALAQPDIEAMNLHGFDCQAGAFNYAHDGIWHVQWDTANCCYADYDWIRGEERLETGLTGVIYRYFCGALMRHPIVLSHGTSKATDTEDSFYTCTRFYDSLIRRRLDIEAGKKPRKIEGDVEWLALTNKNRKSLALLMVNTTDEPKSVEVKVVGKTLYTPIYRTLSCEPELIDCSSVPGETKPWKTMAWEGKYVKGVRDNGWEWGPLLPERLVVEIAPNTIQTVTIPVK